MPAMATKHGSSLSKPLIALCYCFLLVRKIAGRHRRSRTAVPAMKPSPPLSPPPLDKLRGQTLVVDVEGWLLRSPVPVFPYFMLVAVEAGGFLRGLLLLLLYPLLLVFFAGDGGARARAIATVALAGLEEKEVARVGRAVLPKFFLEAAAAEGVEAVRAARRAVAVSATFPRVMVEEFLREYVGVDAVVAPEVRSVAGGVLAGLMGEEDAAEVAARRLRALFGAEMEDVRRKAGGAVGLVGEGRGGRAPAHYLFSPYYCKETFAVSEADKRGWRPLPPAKYPRPLVFHDGRLAFAPTPAAALAMYTYLPFGVALAVFRVAAFFLLPYLVYFPVGALTGMHYRLVAGVHQEGGGGGGGRLYVCNHRTLMDPIIVAAALGRPVTAVTYSLSRVSEMIAPIRTARLTRDREEDQRGMAALLARGDDMVVCPEGTTCREPYLLRFSPLFAELAADVHPVALDTRVGMFHGTSTKPAAKWMDPFYFMMNPSPAYRVEFLARAATAAAPDDDGGGRRHRSGSIDVANRVQRELGKALGFELTGLTRKDKYTVLAGNEGVVLAPAPEPNKK